jgi:hypothetical protein
MMDPKILEAIAVAVRAAIEEMGVAEFKKTSFFMSNRRGA